MSTNAEVLRVQLDKCARRFHSERQVSNVPEHKFWRFENCPSEVCREARMVLGIKTQTLADLAEAYRPVREPGQEG